jgi:hypothetical protein
MWGFLPNHIEKFLPGLFGGRPCGMVSNCPPPVLCGRDIKDIAPVGGVDRTCGYLVPGFNEKS